MDGQPPSRVIGAGRRGGAYSGGVSSIIRSPAVHEAKMELAQHRALEGYGATPAQRHRANQKATHSHMIGGASTGGFSAMDLIFPAHALFGMGASTGGAYSGGNVWDDVKSGRFQIPKQQPEMITFPEYRMKQPYSQYQVGLQGQDVALKGLGAMTGGASTGGMLYHGAPHPTVKGLRWCEHPQAVSGGFWLWDKIKEGANAVYDNVIKPVASVARKVVAPVGNFIGAEFGVPIAGTLADQGLKAIGLGRRGRRGHKSIHPHGMRHPIHGGMSWCHHPQALHGGFWLWDKIKEGANWVGDKVSQGVNWVGEHAGELARKAIEPVGNFIGKEFGIDNAGTMANQGLSMVGLGRRRRGGASTGGFKLFGHELPDTPAMKRAKEEHKARLAQLSPEQQAEYHKDMKMFKGLGASTGGAMCGSGELTITHTGSGYGQVRRGGSLGQTAEDKAREENYKAWARAHGASKKHGGASTGGARSARGAVVSQVMRERGCSLPEASRIVKAEGLY